MSTLQSMLSPRTAEAIIFVVLVVFSVGSLERFGAWVARDASAARSRTVAALLGLVFVLMVAGGIVGYALVGHRNFLNLAFFLNGAAGLMILPATYFRRAKDRELRRIAALDL